MHNPAADPDNMQMTDFWCDFCRSPWSEGRPMVEGHQGSLICGSCLKVAYVETLVSRTSSAPAGSKCSLCLEERTDRLWRSPMHEDVIACERCIRQASTALSQDPDSGWNRPA